MRRIRRFKQRRMTLATKLTLAMTLLAVGAVTSITWLSLKREQKTFRMEMQQQAETLLNSLVITTADALYFDNVDFLEEIVDQLADEEGLVAGRIYQKDGRLVADAHGHSEVMIYSLEADPFGVALLQQRQLVFQWRADCLLASKPVVLGKEAIGAITIGLPTAPLKAKMVAARNQGILVALLAAIAGTLLALLLSRSITQPLEQMTAATKRLAEGDLSQTLNIRSNDELAVLGQAFNRMTAQLQETIGHLEQRASDLRCSETIASEKAMQLECTLHELEQAKHSTFEATTNLQC